MKKQMLAIGLVLMFGLCGCSAYQTTQTTEPREETTETTELAAEESTESLLSSESKREETAEAAEETESPESPAPATPEPQEAKPQTVKDEKSPAVTALPENKNDPASETAKETPAETEKPQEAKQETPKSDELPAPSVTEAPVQKTAYDFEFDMESIKADCIGIGQSMGLTLDASLTPSNAAYWNSVAATQNNQGDALKRNLESYIKFHTAENLGSYGMDEITDFNIYCEARGNGEYLIYFLFA